MRELMKLPMMLLVGCVVGWFFGLMRPGRGFGLVGNVVIGAAGAVAGGWLFGRLDVPPGGVVGAMIGAAVGAVVVLLAAVRAWR